MWQSSTHSTPQSLTVVSFNAKVTSGTPLLKEPKQAGPLKLPLEAGGRKHCPLHAAKFPAFYRTPRFITELTIAHHFSPPSARRIQSKTSHRPTVSLSPTLKPSSHTRLSVPSGLPNSGFPTKTLHPSLPPCMPHAPLITSSSDHPNMRLGVQIMKLLIRQFSPVSCYFQPLSSPVPTPNTPTTQPITF